jgi:nucleoid-associated protein YgaU
VSADSELAATYKVIAHMAPVIAANQGKDSITAVRLNQGDAPAQFKLGNFTLTASYVGRGRVPIAPQPKQPAQPGAPAQTAPPAAARRPDGAPAPMEAAAIVVNSGVDEFYLGGGGIRFEFAANTPGPSTVGLGIVQEGKFVDGKWTIVRQLGGDDIGQGEILTLRPNTILRVLLYRYE